ncbi:MAG TPA: 16S rRNA (cytosine(1402)-N(4))-methyltransferase RsmH [bacterium]|nr:16S rRNA (cytosine(1402)-N(4))-methyltransferase RsmH [bacterium]
MSTLYRGHRPVLLAEFARTAPERLSVYVDLTAGGGGHAEQIVRRYPAARLVLIDRDRAAVDRLKEKFAGMERVTVVHGRAGEVDKILFLLKLRKADYIFADLGVSSYQLDDPERGFGFKGDGPLDMRMDDTKGMTALDLVRRSTEQELQEILSKFGEERESKTVAKALKKAAAAGLTTTKQFRDAIVAAKRFKAGRIDPATQSFMALRIAVNEELAEVERMLERAYISLSPEGVLGVITFHSLEDRIVKHFFTDRRQGMPLPEPFGDSAPRPVTLVKAVAPEEAEVEINPRSRSAKLRVLIKN